MDTYEVRGILLTETLKAFRVQQGDNKPFWIPRSIIPHNRQHCHKETGITDIVMQVEDWFLDKPENKHIECT